MQDSKPTPPRTLRIILWSLIAAFVLFCGGYYLGKDLAQRDNARQSASQPITCFYGAEPCSASDA
ncbi:hypothetical protein [Stenotrophomonas maltophilia]|uniref:hypothetical protein n=1 Tax=Stenotrophomonas maltophilia TaxID=40324 RepID=UPI0021C9D3D7|nr:hypothetical protein [Stenotrophomonas maltophilia]MCU1065838.1 hypothetical protein [Stenotrophomonas maltophilia]MCU1077366.1 hypothetical protein [Stenotrophomonas maltophilia]MCU1141100.1 hypothetical protein [Stenotrophomonas maltophilia]